MIATMIGGIIMLGVGMTIADSHRGFNAMYDRVYSDVVTDGYIARKTFDSVIRRATRTRFLLDSGGNWLEAYYCQDPNTTIVDSYARFSEANGELNIEYGSLNPRQTLSTNTVSEPLSRPLLCTINNKMPRKFIKVSSGGIE